MHGAAHYSDHRYMTIAATSGTGPTRTHPGGGSYWALVINTSPAGGGSTDESNCTISCPVENSNTKRNVRSDAGPRSQTTTFAVATSGNDPTDLPVG